MGHPCVTKTIRGVSYPLQIHQDEIKRLRQERLALKAGGKNVDSKEVSRAKAGKNVDAKEMGRG